MHDPKPVYMPDNEPYLGRTSVFHFDQVILTCLKQNSKVAAYTHKTQLSDIQKAACQIIPQGINLSLAIRELVRQGYLFAALVLLRPLIERTATISYLYKYQGELEKWKAGWNHKDIPSIKKRIETMSDLVSSDEISKILDLYNSLTHGELVAASKNMIKLSNGALGYSCGKVINDSETYDFICS